MSRNEIVDLAFEAFEKVHGLDAWNSIAKQANDRTNAVRLGWRLGFHYALIAIEKKMIFPENENENN